MTDLLEAYKVASVALNTYFCNGFKGRTKTDPVYMYVTENRDVPATYKSYSSCGDRAAATLFRLGCRAKFINRKEHLGWKVGANISNLAFGCPVAKKPGKDWVPSVGCEMLIWNTPAGYDAHSLAIVEYDPKTGRTITANYGAAGMSASTFPGGIFSEGQLMFDGQNWKYGKIGNKTTKIVQRAINLVDILPHLTKAPMLTYIDNDVLPAMSEVQDLINSLRTFQ